MRCKTCHYSLKNLTEHRCPECGGEFDPNDSSTFDGAVSRWGTPLKVCAIIGVLAGLASFVGYGMFGDWSGIHLSKSEGLLFSAFLAVVWASIMFLLSFGSYWVAVTKGAWRYVLMVIALLILWGLLSM